MNKRRSRKNICLTLVIALMVSLGLTRRVHAAEQIELSEEQVVMQMEQDELLSEPQEEYPEVPELVEGEGEITPYYNYTVYIGAWLNFDGSTAYLDACVDGKEGRTTKINGFLYLQKKVGNEWWNVKAWTDSTNNWCLGMDEQWPYLIAGNTYRIRFVAVVYEGSNYERVEFLSDTEYYSGD